MRFPIRFFDRIDKKILALATQPRPAGVKKLQNHGDHWRIRVGDYWIVYIIDDHNKHIFITRVAHRRDVYD